MKEIVAYQCDFCKKYSKSKSYLKDHERNCYHNPKTRACASCGNFYQESKKRHNDEFGTIGYDLPTCKAGTNIACLENEHVKLNLQNHCSHWEKGYIDELE